MFWPFKRKKKQPDMWDDAERNLIAQGIDPRKVRRAAKLVRRLDRAGALPLNMDHEERDTRP
jgi:hypothetical protein